MFNKNGHFQVSNQNYQYNCEFFINHQVASFNGSDLKTNPWHNIIGLLLSTYGGPIKLLHLANKSLMVKWLHGSLTLSGHTFGPCSFSKGTRRQPHPQWYCTKCNASRLVKERKALAQDGVTGGILAANTQKATPNPVCPIRHSPCRFGWCAEHQPKAIGHRLVLGGREGGDIGVGWIGAHERSECSVA